MNTLRTVLLVALAAATLVFCSAADGKKKKRGADGRVDLAGELPPDARRLALGEAAPDFKIKGTDGRNFSLADFAASPLLMVVFLSNHCPYSHAAETRLIPLAKEFAGRGLAVVAISPNRPDAVTSSELGYRLRRQLAADSRTTTHHLYDGASTDVLVKAVDPEWQGPLPHTVVIAPNGKVIYRHNGSVDPAKLLEVVLGALGTFYQP